MANNLYAYFRATARQYLRDVRNPDPRAVIGSRTIDTSTRFRNAEADGVLLLGDPHPENIGSFRQPNGRIIIEFNDFDGAGYGPYYWDVRRMGVGVLAGGEMITRARLANDSLGVRAARASIQGYAKEIYDLSRGEPPLRLESCKCGRAFSELLAAAKRNGYVDRYLHDYTVVKNNQRRFRYGVVEAPVIGGVIEDEIRSVTPKRRKRILAALREYQATAARGPIPDEELAVKGVAQRLGAGVSSYPGLRFYVLTEGPTHALHDDVLIELKELGAPFGVKTNPRASYRQQGERYVALQRMLQGVEVSDPYLGWTSFAARPMRVRHRSGFQRGIKVSKAVKRIYKRDWTENDYIEFAFNAGRLLARSHAHTRTLSGKLAKHVIAAAIDGHYRAFITEHTEFVKAYGEVLKNDFERFRMLLNAHGPTLKRAR